MVQFRKKSVNFDHVFQLNEVHFYGSFVTDIWLFNNSTRYSRLYSNTFFMIANFAIEDKRTTTGWKDNIRPDSVFGIFLIATILWICTFFLSKISTLPSWLEPVIYVLGIIGEVIKMLPVLWENMF